MHCFVHNRLRKGLLLLTVDIFLLESNIDFELMYTYRVPDSISGEIKEGVFVDVRFGRHNSMRTGIVWSVDFSETPVGASKNGYKLKDISGINRDYLPLTDSQMRICDAIKRRYLCVTGDAVHYFMSPKLKPAKKIRTAGLGITAEAAEDILKPVDAGWYSATAYYLCFIEPAKRAREAVSHWKRAAAYEALGRTEEALWYLESTLEKDPQNLSAYFMRTQLSK